MCGREHKTGLWVGNTRMGFKKKNANGGRRPPYQRGAPGHPKATQTKAYYQILGSGASVSEPLSFVHTTSLKLLLFIFFFFWKVPGGLKRRGGKGA